MVFHWSLSDSKSSQVSRILLSILVVLNNAVVWMVSTCPSTSKSSNPFNNLFITVLKAPIMIGIIITSLLLLLLSLLLLFPYYLFFLLIFTWIIHYFKRFFKNHCNTLNSIEISVSELRAKGFLISYKTLPKAFTKFATCFKNIKKFLRNNLFDAVFNTTFSFSFSLLVSDTSHIH